MNYTRLLACVLLLSPLAGSAQTIVKQELYAPTKNETARRYYDEGTTASDKGDFKGAIPKLKAAIAADPGYIDAYDNLGVAYRRLNMLDSAEYYYRESNRRYPQGVVALRNLGVVYESRGKLAQALDFYKQTIKLRPEDPEGYFALARGYSMLQQFPEALENALTAEKYYKRENSKYIGDCYLITCMIYIMTNKKEDARRYRDLAKASGKEIPEVIANELK